MREELVRQAVSDGLGRIREHAIGEGNYGIVFSLPGSPDLCGKYAKFEYRPWEYTSLRRAFDAGLPVPYPTTRFHDLKTFVMERIPGATLEELAREPCRFSEVMGEQVVEAAKKFSRLFRHNDLFPRNVMIRNPEWENGVVVRGSPVIIDLERTQVGEGDDWKSLEEWMRRHVA